MKLDLLTDPRCRRILSILGGRRLELDEIADAANFTHEKTRYWIDQLLAERHIHKGRTRDGRVLFAMAEVTIEDLGDAITTAPLRSHLIAGAGKIRRDCENEVRCRLGFRGEGHCPPACDGFIPLRLNINDFASVRTWAFA